MLVNRFALLFFVLLFSAANSAFAQLAVIKGWEVDETLAERRAAIFQQARSGNAAADLDTFLEKYYFARWTNPKNIGQIQIFVREFLTQDLADATGNARNALLEKTHTFLQKMWEDNAAPPPARYNAVLVLGQLYQREAQSRGDKPVPYDRVLPTLITLYEKKDNPEYIRLGALVGIARHAHIGIADNGQKNNVSQIFISTIAEGKPVEAEKRSKEEQEKLNWFRFYAVAGIAALKTVNAQTVESLTGVIENPQESLELRTQAARAFGDIDWKAATDAQTQIDIQHLSATMMSLLKSANDAEIQTVTQLRDKTRASGGGAAGMPGMSGGGMSTSMTTMPMTSMGDGISGANDPGYNQLTIEKQLEIQGAVKSIKANFQNILYGINGKYPNPFTGGQITAGVISLIPAEDPAVGKLDKSVKAARKLFQQLDEGLPEDASQRSTMTMGGSDPMMSASMSGTTSGPGGVRPGAPRRDEKVLKVNFASILKALNDFGAELDGVITGKGT